MGTIVRFKNWGKLEKQLKKKLEKCLKDKGMLSECGEYIVKTIKRNTRSKGKYINGENFDALADSTKEQRARMAKYNKTHSTYSKGRSNLTFSGEMIESINYEIKSGKPKLSIISEGDHAPYKNKSGKSSGKTISNKELIRIHQKKRRILGVNEVMVNILRNIIRRNLRRLLGK